MSQATTVQGVVLITRHGDRYGFYQNPISYTGQKATVTDIGQQQEYQLGQLLASLYLNSTSPSVISSMATNGTYVPNQLIAYADDGPGSATKLDSAVALLQGLYPPNNDTSPLSGYQYVPVHDIAPADTYWMEAWSNCPAFEASNKQVYASSDFVARAKEAQPFLESLQPLLGGRPVAFENLWNIWDFVNVQYIHNATFAALVDGTGPSTMPMLRSLANYKEQAIYTSPEPKAPANLASNAMLSNIVAELRGFTNATQPRRLTYYSSSYKTFLPFFSMTEVAAQSPDVVGFVEYAGAITLELRSNAAGDDFVRLNFKNGSADASFRPLVMFNSGQVDLPLATFEERVEPYTVSSLSQWCGICDNDSSRGCELISAINGTAYDAARGPLTPTQAGLVGFGATLGFCLLVGALVAALLLRRRGRKASNGQLLRSDSQTSSMITAEKEA